MSVYIVLFISHDIPQAFVFADAHESEEFQRHIEDLYGIPTTSVLDQIQTYDSAIQAVVEAFGPSPE